MSNEMPGKKELIKIRRAEAPDVNFIYSTWLMGLYYGNDWFRSMDKNMFFDEYHKILDKLLIKPGVIVLVACLIEDEDVILGYSVQEGLILHWVFLKDHWRKLGIAKDLVSKDTRVVTHLTKVGRSIKPKGWKFNPFLIQ